MTKEKLRVLICDDMEGMRMVLNKLISMQEGFEVCALAADGEQCMELFAKHKPQVVFLDVEMPGQSGLECAQQIMDIEPHTYILFATAHTQFMDRAFELYAFDYLVKPFKAERVASSLARIQLLRAQSEAAPAPLPERKRGSGKLMVKNRDSLSFVDMGDIILIQRENRATVIYTAEASYPCAETLTAIEEKLDGAKFFRSHKSYIINIDYIDNITPYGRWTYIIRFKGIKNDALITYERFEALKENFS